MITFDWIFSLSERIGVNSSPNGNHSRDLSPGLEELNTQIEEARIQSNALSQQRQVIKDKIAKKEKKREKKKKRREAYDTSDSSEYNTNSNMSDVQADINGATIIPSEMLPTERALEDEANDRLAEEERRKNRDPPIVFEQIDVRNFHFY